jgi:hypothetical protein
MLLLARGKVRERHLVAAADLGLQLMVLLTSNGASALSCPMPGLMLVQ